MKQSKLLVALMTVAAAGVANAAGFSGQADLSAATSANIQKDGAVAQLNSMAATKAFFEGKGAQGSLDLNSQVNSVLSVSKMKQEMPKEEMVKEMPKMGEEMVKETPEMGKEMAKSLTEKATQKTAEVKAGVTAAVGTTGALAKGAVGLAKVSSKAVLEGTVGTAGNVLTKATGAIKSTTETSAGLAKNTSLGLDAAAGVTSAVNVGSLASNLNVAATVGSMVRPEMISAGVIGNIAATVSATSLISGLLVR